MAIELNHTIVHVADPTASAASITEILGLPAATRYGPFLVVTLTNGVSLDYLQNSAPEPGQHYAFLVSENEFDEIHARVTGSDITYWADPHGHHENQISHNDGGRGFYWTDVSTHWYEVLTRPYGSGS